MLEWLEMWSRGVEGREGGGRDLAVLCDPGLSCDGGHHCWDVRDLRLNVVVFVMGVVRVVRVSVRAFGQGKCVGLGIG